MGVLPPPPPPPLLLGIQHLSTLDWLWTAGLQSCREGRGSFFNRRGPMPLRGNRPVIWFLGHMHPLENYLAVPHGFHSASSWFPNVILMFSQLSACLDEAILHGNGLKLIWNYFMTWVAYCIFHILTVTREDNGDNIDCFYSVESGKQVLSTYYYHMIKRQLHDGLKA